MLNKIEGDIVIIRGCNPEIREAFETRDRQKSELEGLVTNDKLKPFGGQKWVGPRKPRVC